MTSTAGEIKIDVPGKNQRKLVGKVVSDKPAEATPGADAPKTTVKRVRKTAAPATPADGKGE